ncbi:MAG: RNA methyltransferase [Caldilineaceae bacterium]
MITSLDNAQVKEARKLQRRRQRQRTGTCLVEGVRLVRDARTSGAVVHRLFYAPPLIAANASALALIAACEADHVPLLACSVEVFQSLTETVTPQGVAAIIAIPQLPLPQSLQFVLILDQLRDPGNAGTLLRTAEAAGIGLAIFGPETVDAFNDKVVRAGMGAHFRLPLRTCATWDEIHALLGPTPRYYVAEAHATMLYTDVDWMVPCALIVGGEAAGASAAVAKFAQPVAIPMPSQVESLNAAVAGAVILFEAARQRRMK